MTKKLLYFVELLQNNIRESSVLFIADTKLKCEQFIVEHYEEMTGDTETIDYLLNNEDYAIHDVSNYSI